MKLIAWCLSVLFTTAATAATSQIEPTVVLTSSRISIESVTPRGQVVLFGASLKGERGMPTLRRFQEILTDQDGDGSISFDPSGGIPLRSIWAVVDIESGAKAIRVPEGYELTEREISTKELRKESDGSTFSLVLEKSAVDLLLIRPGQGAWSLRAREGGSRDGDHATDGKLTLLFEAAQPLAPECGKAPKHLKAGDVILAIDSGRMELFTWTMTK